MRDLIRIIEAAERLDELEVMTASGSDVRVFENPVATRIIEGPHILYHGTCSAYLPEIEKHGLRAMTSRDNPDRRGIYLTDDLIAAQEYGDLACTRAEDDGLVERGTTGVVVLSVSFADLDPTYFEPDDYELRDAINAKPGSYEFDDRLGSYTTWSEVPWQMSLDVANQVLYTKDIPVSVIRRVL